MTREILGIGPRSPPITGPGLKNRYVQAGLEDHGLDIHWVNTLETRPRTVVELLSEAVSYDAYVLSASTKVRLGVAPLLATKLRSPDVYGALFPAGGEFADELRALPGPVQRFYRRTFSTFDGVYPQTDELSRDLRGLFDDSVHVRTVPNLRPLPSTTASRTSGDASRRALPSPLVSFGYSLLGSLGVPKPIVRPFTDSADVPAIHIQVFPLASQDNVGVDVVGVVVNGVDVSSRGAVLAELPHRLARPEFEFPLGQFLALFGTDDHLSFELSILALGDEVRLLAD
jgi:hypothetical protein